MWNYTVKLAKGGTGTCAGAAFPTGLKTVSRSDLVGGMMRTILKPGTSFHWRRAIALISDYLMGAALDNSTPSLYLAPDYSDALRDFSGTTRSGELAQALAHAYFTRHTQYKILVDYSAAAEYAFHSTGIPIPPKGPDFLFVDPNLAGGYIIVECKGVRDPSPVRYKDGLAQATVGDNYLAGSLGIRANNKFAAVTKWRFDATAGGVLSSLQLKDPAKEGKLSAEAKRRLMRVGFSTWFEFARNDGFEALRTGQVPLLRLAGDAPWVFIGQNERFECFVARPLLAQILSREPKKGWDSPFARNFTRRVMPSILSGGLGRLPDLEILQDGTAFRLRKDRLQ